MALARDHTLGSVMSRLASAHGPRILVEQDNGLLLTYAQAATLVDRWAGAVARNVRRGDRVVVHLPNGYEMLLACLAVSRAGGIAVPVNPQMRADEIEHVVADSGARFVVESTRDLEGAPALGAARQVAADDVAALFYTSGTTGKPKGAELTHHGILGNLTAASLVPPSLVRGEAVVALPVAHIMGFLALLGLACAGVRVYAIQRFRPLDVLDAIEHRRAAYFIGVPAMYRLLDEAGAATRDLRCVRVWASGADVMPDELARAFQKYGAQAVLPGVGKVGDAVFAEGYGMVELGGAAAVKVSGPVRCALAERVLPGDSLGFALPGWKLKVVDDDGREVGVGQVGELWVKGPGTLRGYHNDPAATAATLTDDGWVRTGDLARRGAAGAFQFAGRKKDVIKSGGYSVFAVEVEAALAQHPAVAEVAVVGLPDERLGELPVAAVRLQPGARVEVDELVSFAREQLADYKVPRRIVVVDELPQTGTSKVQKRQLLGLFTS